MKKKDSLIPVYVDGTFQYIHQSIRSITDSQLFNPTPEDPKFGICHTCNGKNQFMPTLMDLDNPDSCFMKNHDIESFAGIQPKRGIEAWGDIVEYTAYVSGEMSL